MEGASRTTSFGLFGIVQEHQLEFGEIFASFTCAEELEDIKITVGKGIHEIIKESNAKARNPFVFKRALVNLLQSES